MMPSGWLCFVGLDYYYFMDRPVKTNTNMLHLFHEIQQRCSLVLGVTATGCWAPLSFYLFWCLVIFSTVVLHSEINYDLNIMLTVHV